MNKTEVIKFLILRTVGNFLVLFAIFGILATFGPVLYYEVSFKIVQFRGVKYVVAATAQPSAISHQPSAENISSSQTGGIDNFASVLAGAKEQILVPVDTQFSIVIPRIGASAKIFPNVDASNQDEFLPILMQGVAHAKGSVFPGMKGNIYLFAHSTDNFWDVGRYNAVFYLLKDLKEGDEVDIFYQNTRYNYIVTGSKIVSPTDVSYLVNGQAQTTENLILQTCWPPGTTWQRLLVLAKPK